MAKMNNKIIVIILMHVLHVDIHVACHRTSRGNVCFPYKDSNTSLCDEAKWGQH